MQENQGKWMQVRRAVLMVLTGAALALGEGAMAQATPKPPERLTYQGFIAGSDGVALGNAAPKNYDVIFRIYDSEGSNTPLWGEQQTVTVDKGYFSVLLGEGAAVTGVPNAGITLSSLFTGATASDRYVGFTVKGIGTGGADVDILPRVRLMTSPYAFLAGRALNADAASKLVQASGADLLSSSGGQVLLSGALGVGSTNVIEFGQGVAAKTADSGKIGYGTLSGDSLDIVGAGNSVTNRKVRLWSAGGVTSDGPITAPSINTPVVYIQDVGGVMFGHGRTKNYAPNGLITYGSIGGVDRLIINGGGIDEANRRVIMYNDGGFYVLGPQSVRGKVGIEGSNVLELGQGVAGKEGFAGMIGYGTFSGDSLDIVGAGTSQATRRVMFHSQGGVRFIGPVAVNTAANPAFPLDVSGFVVTGTWGISLRVSNGVLANSYQTSSDRRIKDVLGLSSSQKDMDALRRVRVTNYKMKDRLPGDERPIKGVIAQDLQEALPDAVTQIPNVIPDILKDAQGIEGGVGGKSVVIRMAEPHGIKAGDRVRIQMDDQVQDVAVLEVPDAKSFTYASSGEVPKKVRVIGREVQDFLSVDYQQIYMTAVSALQEVDRRVQALEKREAAVMELEKKAARVDALERDVAELRKLVAALATPAGKDKASASVAPGPDSVSVAKAR